MKIHGRQIIDSRGSPTIEVDVEIQGHMGRAAVPSGASTGSHEAIELRDEGKEHNGRSVHKAIDKLPLIAKKLHSSKSIQEIDEALIGLDGTDNKSSLGANTTLGVSMAATRALAQGSPLYKYLNALCGKPSMKLPMPFANVINGGKHASGGLAIQEIMIVPTGATSFSQATQMICETFHALKQLLESKGHSTLVGDEGGFAPNVERIDDALDLVMEAIILSGYKGKMSIAMDAAASEFYKDEQYHLHTSIPSDMLAALYLDLIKRYPIISIEDPFAEDDFSAYREFISQTDIQVVGDDITVTNTKRMELAKDLCNSLLLKVNQIGTVTEAIAAANLAKDYGWSVMVSHRSGETEDTFIADLAVALGCGQIKLGAPCRSERTCKYNQLLRIEEESGLPFTKL